LIQFACTRRALPELEPELATGQPLGAISKDGVVPDVLVTVGDNEPPTRRESKLGQQLRSPFPYVLDVQWLEEVVAWIEGIACPQIPTTRPTLGLMANPFRSRWSGPGVAGAVQAAPVRAGCGLCIAGGTGHATLAC